jgi:hypothetical protein
MLSGLFWEFGGVSDMSFDASSSLMDHTIWVVIFQAPRPGPPVPKGSNYLTIGWKQIFQAFKQYKQLPYTFIYLFAFFLLADVSIHSAKFALLFLRPSFSGFEHDGNFGLDRSE